jgi:hypothetical protein
VEDWKCRVCRLGAEVVLVPVVVVVPVVLPEYPWSNGFWLVLLLLLVVLVLVLVLLLSQYHWLVVTSPGTGTTITG